MPDATIRVGRPQDAFLHDVLKGLGLAKKSIRSRWLYNSRGSELFESITEVDEYYPSRAETAILQSFANEIANFAGDSEVLLEYGAGAGVKTEILIAALQSLHVYVPIDVADDFLRETSRRLGMRFPQLITCPVTADFTSPFALPSGIPSRRMGFFPGSTMGNLSDEECAAFLEQMRHQVGQDGVAVIGIDLVKDIASLLAAYDDDAGVTAEFNLNLLHRMNEELGADFSAANFYHQARWNESESAVEMHLVSHSRQRVEIGGSIFEFLPDETIHTETSRKYRVEAFAKMIQASGWEMQKTWLDPEKRFAVCGLRACNADS